jgi:hypothetical protein
MLYRIKSALGARAEEAGQGMAEYILIHAPLSAVLALTVCSFIIASNK